MVWRYESEPMEESSCAGQPCGRPTKAAPWWDKVSRDNLRDIQQSAELGATPRLESHAVRTAESASNRKWGRR